MLSLGGSSRAECHAHFKLHAPFNTTVEAHVAGGKIVDLTVTPASRAADVVEIERPSP